MTQDALQEAIKRDRVVLVGVLVGIGSLAWAYMVHMARAMEGGGACHAAAMPYAGAWSISEAMMAFTMWVAMMVAMMLPIVSPWILVLSKAKRERNPRQTPLGVAAFFLLGYIVIWTCYSAFATVGQWRLHESALLSARLVGTSPILGGVMLLAAGIWQWTPMRDACMMHCRSPLGFFLASWKDGRWGAFSMGFRHGLYCVGCCWILMALSFVFGVMNLLWMAGITLFIIAEKATSWGPRAGRVGGLILIGIGLWVLGNALSAT